MLQLQRGQLLLLPIARDRAGQRVRREPLQRIGKLGHFLFTPRRKTIDAFHSQFASCERSGFVQSHQRGPGKLFDRRPAPK